MNTNTQQKNKKQKKVVPYTEDERNKKIAKIMLQLITLNVDHVITDEIRENINIFIKTGKEYHTSLELPTYSRTLEVNLVNDKNKGTDMKLLFKKIRVKNEDDAHPINKLNILQETLFDDVVRNDK